MNPRAFGIGRRWVGWVGRELIHSFSCVPACSAHSLSLSHSISLPPLFLETSHSRESGPSCSQRLSLASSRPLLLSARVSAVYDIRRKERVEEEETEPFTSLSQTQEGEGERRNALWIFNSPYLHSWQVTDGCVFASTCVIMAEKGPWEGDRQQFLTWQSPCIYAAFVEQNHCDDATTFLASILICRAALMAVLIDYTWLDW